jgi:hypothetical protein
VGSSRLRLELAKHVWSYDFVSAATHDGRTLRLLTLIDKYTRECLAIRVVRRLGSRDVIKTRVKVMAGNPGASVLGQLPRVHRSGVAGVAGEPGTIHMPAKNEGGPDNDEFAQAG